MGILPTDCPGYDMRALSAWLDRLGTIKPNDKIVESRFRLTVPGFEPLDVADWLLSVEPQGPLRSDFRASSPESLSIIRLVDLPGREKNFPERHRLGADLACLISLALDRRIVITHEIAISVPQLSKMVFQPVLQIIDRSVLGPLPDDPKDRLQVYISHIAGLDEENRATIGAAASSYHGALVIFDRDARAAYTLLVAGIEILSRQYGSPPTDWTEWQDSAGWETFITDQHITSSQADALREKLMKGKQLRLGATFRTYAASRLTDGFWDKQWEEWIYGIRANDGQWLPSTPLESRTIADILPRHRIGLQKALGLSYGLRSAVVHEANWVELLSLAQPPSMVDLSKPLPFSILRAILAELIWLEMSARSTPRPLPDFVLLR